VVCDLQGDTRFIRIILTAIERSHAAQPHPDLGHDLAPITVITEQPSKASSLGEHLKECSIASTESVEIESQAAIHSIDDSLVSTPLGERSEQLINEEGIKRFQQNASDQPPSSVKTTDDKQERTPKIINIIRQECSWLNGYNARVGAQIESCKKAAVRILDLFNAELAAERERREQAEEKNKAQVNTFDLLGDALGINPQNEFTEELFVAVANLKGQLLSALAAIEGILEADKTNKELDLSIAIENCKHVDLSALREHDEKVRKPLIDGLNRLMALVDVKCIEQAKRAYGAALVKMNP
jgi:hypothetical protein